MKKENEISIDTLCAKVFARNMEIESLEEKISDYLELLKCFILNTDSKLNVIFANALELFGEESYEKEAADRALAGIIEELGER